MCSNLHIPVLCWIQIGVLGPSGVFWYGEPAKEFLNPSSDIIRNHHPPLGNHTVSPLGNGPVISTATIFCSPPRTDMIHLASKLTPWTRRWPDNILLQHVLNQLVSLLSSACWNTPIGLPDMCVTTNVNNSMLNTTCPPQAIIICKYISIGYQQVVQLLPLTIGQIFLSVLHYLPQQLLPSLQHLWSLLSCLHLLSCFNGG